ncbi:MAG: hypothetical protein JXQ29_00155 [Planctomycetes bacterium]|nr:hypothetical protein [Planctomycetota bacterium]
MSTFRFERFLGDNRLVGLVFLLVSLAVLAGCACSEKADAFIVNPRFSERDALATIGLYIPNRVVDLLDVVHVGYGVGPGFGLDVHLTRYGRLCAVAGVDVGAAWLGRHTSPFQYGVHARAAAGPAQAPAELAEHVWRWPQWDIGVYYHALLDHIYVAVAPDEIVDFFAGLITLDLKDDDF